MKKMLLVALLLTSLGCWADSLQIGPGVGTDPVLLSSNTSFTVFSNPGQNVGDIATLFLFFSVPTDLVSAFPGAVSGSSPTLTLVNNFGALLTNSGCGDVYTCVGLSQLNNSNSFTNYTGGAVAAGLTAPSSYTILEYSDSSILNNHTLSFTGVNLPQGTYIVAYGTDANGNEGSTAFTHAGLVGPPGGPPPPPVPEPATLALLGSGLAFVATLARRKLRR